MDNNILEQKNTETMQAPSPRKKPEFFCSSIIVYAYIEKMQDLFSILINDQKRKPIIYSNLSR